MTFTATSWRALIEPLAPAVSHETAEFSRW
jgi:hypothetical protein